MKQYLDELIIWWSVHGERNGYFQVQKLLLLSYKQILLIFFKDVYFLLDIIIQQINAMEKKTPKSLKIMSGVAE